MFKSECLILIFILVILAILYFNTYTVELFTSKKITINKEENKELIANNIQRIIDTIEKYKEFDKIVKDIQGKITNKLSEKLKKTTTMQGEITTKSLLETEKLKLETDNSSYKRDRKKHIDDRVVLNLDVEELKRDISKNKKEQERITKEKEEIKLVTTDDVWLKYLLAKSGSTDTTDTTSIIEQLLELDKEYESLDTSQLTLEKEDKQDQIMELNSQIIELDKNIGDNDLELAEIEPQIPQLKSKILKLEKAIEALTREIEELETEKKNEIIKRTNSFNELNEQLVSYELEELVEDLEILKKTQKYYEKKLEQFKEHNKIEFGKLKIKEDIIQQIFN